MDFSLRDLTNEELAAVSGGEIKQIGKCTYAPAGHELKTAINTFINAMVRIWGGGPSTDPWE